ncbi:MAG: hypothetical protein HC901_00365, partial [Bdellovibrionaceae bacterium]|nr:hypothetical protein [Pseudobdellovibrionaceae bacterium]
MKDNTLPAAAIGLHTNTAKPARKLIQPRPLIADAPRLKIETAAAAPKPKPAPA